LRSGGAFDAEIVDEGAGLMDISVEGRGAEVLLREAGGHRWQRVPPTERSGRVHTSTVTVAALEALAPTAWTLRESDIEVFTTKDSGPGGQHRNKRETCVVMRHLPTGIEAKSAAKSQHANKRMAREILEGRVREHFASRAAAKHAATVRDQRGSGMRGDKVRTYRVRDDQVTDHRSGSKVRLSRVLAGDLPDCA
jgi:peptide chain release factor 1